MPPCAPRWPRCTKRSARERPQRPETETPPGAVIRKTAKVNYKARPKEEARPNKRRAVVS